MFTQLYRFIAVVSFAFLAGCASGPTPQQIAAADYGTAIDQDQAEERIKQYFSGTLKDPYSAQYQFGAIQKGYVIGSAIEGKQLYAGYLITANVNAKNSYGGYTGNQGYQFLFQNGALVKGLKMSPGGMMMPLF
ncbi:hypothetical protein ACIOAU_15810 [Pseudomonas sp. NPDC088322]|uniref:hypothetical protein n=1 Tax=Pseudomonas sp. NPDC088322 TaxID=3364452 RepID=UPI0037F701B1